MSDPLTGLSLALRNQTQRELYDSADKHHSFFAMLMAMDKLYDAPSRFIKSTDITGEKRQVNYRTSLPVVQGAYTVTGSLASLELPAQQNYNVVGGKQPWSHYQLREDIRRSYVDHIAGKAAPGLNWIKDVSKAAADAVIKKLSEDAFPAAAVSTSTYTAAENAIMALAYPLQTATSGTYDYLEINFAQAQYQALQATVKTSLGVPSLSNIRTNLLIPLKLKGANTDVIICDSGVYDYILTVAEGKILMPSDTKLEYGGEFIKYGNRYWVPEERMDAFYTATGARELYVLDTGTWEFCQQGISDSFEIGKNPDTATLLTMLGMFTCQLTCLNARHNGRATGVTLS